MSTWRRKAIQCLPLLKEEFEQPATSIYTVFFELLPAVVEAHRRNDTATLKKIYDFAAWCFAQKEKELWNAAAVAFYEHLGNYSESRNAMNQWITLSLYNEIRGLLELQMDDEVELQKLDLLMGYQIRKK